MGALGSRSAAFNLAGIGERDGVYFGNSSSALVADFELGLMTFKFLDRFPLDV